MKVGLYIDSLGNLAWTKGMVTVSSSSSLEAFVHILMYYLTNACHKVMKEEMGLTNLLQLSIKQGHPKP